MSPREIRRAVSNKEMELIVPKLLWQQQDLTSNQTAMNFIQSLRDKGLVSMTTVLPLLSLDPETEKRNLENERGTVFDENAPKTGPLIQEGKPINNAFETGDTIRENAPQREDNIEDSATSRPTINTEKPTTGNNPEDFGLERKTSLDFDNVFTKRGDNKVTKRIKTKQD